MILIAGFLEVLFRGLIFIGLALSIGGIAFNALVLRRSSLRDQPTSLFRALRLISSGALIIAASQMLFLLTAPWAMEDDSGRWPFALFLATGFARAGMLRAAMAAGLWMSARRLRARPDSRTAWFALYMLAAAILIDGAWLVHGASRMENATRLMAITVIHQLAGAVWIGGTIHLVAQWRLLRKDSMLSECWSELPGLFSPAAIASVTVLLAAGLTLSWHYVGDTRGLLGTAYGTMVLTKALLMCGALAMGGLSFMAVRRLRKKGDPSHVRRRTPHYIETEAAIGAVILMAAAALTGQPPSVDTVAQRATPLEVAQVFAPKKLQLRPAPLAELNAKAGPALDPFAVSTKLDKIQSNFNHNVSGLFMLLIGLAALFQGLTRARWARHWPLLFLPFWGFLVVFAQPTGWPLGKKGFWESLFAADVLQHRMGTMLVAGLGVFEWLVQTERLKGERWRYAFPLLCFVGGGLLLSHTHSLFPDKSVYLIEVSHNALGILAVTAGAAGWLEKRLEGRLAAISGIAWRLSLILVGWVLITYTEI